ncbi:MAG: TonB-dependent receptor [Bacteroidetes bacterium]|nr:TonB-dependent receptor [Bacteroidota bacterium]
MLKKLFFSLGILLSVNLMVFSQSGELKGKITDKDTKEPIAFANIIIEQAGKQFGGGTTDFDGNYTIKPIPAGHYDVKATYVGYKPLLIKGVIINADKMTFNNIVMEPTSTTLETFTVVDYKVPLISRDQTSSGATLTSEDISRMPGRTAESVAATMGGVQSVDGAMGSVRGARSDDGSTVTYVDGVRVRGNVNLPKSAMGEVSMILGGIPAKYGEATGGVMNIVTTGPSREFGGGLEFVTSQFLDKFGRNLFSFNLTGPLLKNKDDKKSSLLGFFIAGEFGYTKDTRPFANGDYKVNDTKRTYLEQNPLRIENGVVRYNADFLRMSDLEKIYSKEDGADYSANFSGKVDVRTTKTTNLQFGGNFSYDKGRSWSRANSLLNSTNNGEFILTTWSVNGKFTQRFPAEKDSKSLIKNVFYQIQADYSKTNQTLQDRNHKDNLFNYGYVGKFTTTMKPTFITGSDTVAGIVYDNALVMANYSPANVTFERSEINPTLANYTSQLYNSFGQNAFANLLTIQSMSGMRNGDTPKPVYSLYNRTGTVYDGYNLYDNTQIGISLNGSADIGNHAFEFGIQYEQITERNVGYSPARLWELARTLTNSHIDQINTSDPYLRLGGLQDTIYYNFIYNQAKQSTFDINLRQKLGMPVNGHSINDWIDIDKYDPSTYSIEMFSPDELLESGNNRDNPLINYYGYDYKGKKLSSKPSLNDFFTAKDENGRYKREIGAFEPLYMAGYIQDKFAFNDLIFNVGVRVDRFDANQMVLKDPYLFYDSKTVKDVTGSLNKTNGGSHPSNIGSDYVVYVDDYKSSSPNILGYRSGNVWYSATGTVVSDPTAISGNSGSPTPYRVNKDQTSVSIDAFKDYDPQITFMPRVAFSFPISDEALFFAHYDVITKRPTDGLRLDPISYLYIANSGSNTVNNPNLLPEQTTDYELGFQQKISNSSSLKFSAFYREMRNQVQTKRFTGADPNPNYLSYTNIDFGTVKGLTVAYDLRRTGNIRVSANYTLQFANGTGSNSESQKAMVSSGQPNLRTMTPLTYDQRHAVKASIDYRFEGGKKYNGPKITKKIKGTDKVKTILLFENTGINVTFNGSSGTPYTKRDFNENTIVGQLNGSRLPWQFWIDAQINKAFMLKVGSRMLDLNIYLSVLNVLNSQNIRAVYGTTGNPNDDGYLTNPKYQSQINAYEDPQSYRDLRSVSTDSPYNYSLPRRIRLGLELNF